jgi:hypothetical protein
MEELPRQPMMSTRPASPPLGVGGVQRVLIDEVVAQDLGGEGVEQLLVGVREVRHLVVGEFLDGLGRDAGRDRLLVMRVPRVLRVEVPGRDQQRQLPEPLVDAGVESAVGAERIHLLGQLGRAQPDQERPAGSRRAWRRSRR